MRIIIKLRKNDIFILIKPTIQNFSIIGICKFKCSAAIIEMQKVIEVKLEESVFCQIKTTTSYGFIRVDC